MLTGGIGAALGMVRCQNVVAKRQSEMNRAMALNEMCAKAKKQYGDSYAGYDLSRGKHVIWRTTDIPQAGRRPEQP